MGLTLCFNWHTYTLFSMYSLTYENNFSYLARESLLLPRRHAQKFLRTYVLETKKRMKVFRRERASERESEEIKISPHNKKNLARR
jgi:hypothetical protein